MHQRLPDVNSQNCAIYGMPAPPPSAGERDDSNYGMSKTGNIFEERGLTEEDIAAHGFLLNLPAIERIGPLSLAADQRREGLFREMERKRASFAQQVRTATADVLDVEHTECR